MSMDSQGSVVELSEFGEALYLAAEEQEALTLAALLAKIPEEYHDVARSLSQTSLANLRKSIAQIEGIGKQFAGRFASPPAAE